MTNNEITATDMLEMLHDLLDDGFDQTLSDFDLDVDGDGCEQELELSKLPAPRTGFVLKVGTARFELTMRQVKSAY